MRLDHRSIAAGRRRLPPAILFDLGILRRARKVYGLAPNAAAEVETFPQRRSGDIEVFSPEQVWALVRAAASEQDGAIYLTAAFTGLRLGELDRAAVASTSPGRRSASAPRTRTAP